MKSEIFFTSDTHFFHRRITEFCPKTRPFETMKQMNSAIVEAHNSVVKEHDVVYMLGDVSFASMDSTIPWIKMLNGRKHLILGNHDDRLMKSTEALSLFESVQQVKMVRHDGMKFWLSHYPHRSWPDSHRGSYHLYGHVHGALMQEDWGRSMDVGLDTRPGLVPYHIDEVVSLLKDKPFTNGSQNVQVNDW